MCSSDLPFLTAPILGKADSNCIANQQTLTVAGTSDPAYTPAGFLVYIRETGTVGWTFVNTATSVGGIIPDTSFNIGIGNEWAGLNIDVMLVMNDYPNIVSNILQITTAPPC